MFDNIAHKYDFLNHFFFRYRCALAEALHKDFAQGKSPNHHDMATGTADFAIEAIRMGLNAHVTGVDLGKGC